MVAAVATKGIGGRDDPLRISAHLCRQGLAANAR
jgi:hypothetical protein